MLTHAHSTLEDDYFAVTIRAENNQLIRCSYKPRGANRLRLE